MSARWRQAREVRWLLLRVPCSAATVLPWVVGPDVHTLLATTLFQPHANHEDDLHMIVWHSNECAQSLSSSIVSHSSCEMLECGSYGRYVGRAVAVTMTTAITMSRCNGGSVTSSMYATFVVFPASTATFADGGGGGGGGSTPAGAPTTVQINATSGSVWESRSVMVPVKHDMHVFGSLCCTQPEEGGARRRVVEW